MTAAHIIQVGPVLCEDGKTILFHGYTASDDLTFIQSVTLPIEIEQTNFDPNEWRAAIRADQWREWA